MSTNESTQRAAIDLPLNQSGTIFIEASAGTGKTHTLTSLVARLVVEEGRQIDQILAVTFTRAATAELRSKIRGTLSRALAHVEALLRQDAEPPDDDPQARELIAAWKKRRDVDFNQARLRLETAMLHIDRASVYTIHGFCQRVLTDLAFESSLPFGFEMVGDADELVAGATWDAWRRRFYSAPETVARYVLEKNFLPDEVSKWITDLRAKTNVLIRGADPLPVDFETGLQDCEDAWSGVRLSWDDHSYEFEQELTKGTWLNRNTYRAGTVEKDLDLLRELISQERIPLGRQESFIKYGRINLEQACKNNHELPENPLFDKFDFMAQLLASLDISLDLLLRRARKEALQEVRRSIRDHIREHRTLSYDDLLLELDAALDGPGKERLTMRIRHDYPCALIDEYQDTDPVQANIFDRVYGTDSGDAAPRFDGRGDDGQAALRIVVGDPKQSIYRFRGADVYAYLRARQQARETLPLGFNWRSAPALVEAVNAVFRGDASFVAKQIRFSPVRPAHDEMEALRIDGDDDPAPFRFQLFPKPKSEKTRPTKRSMAGKIAKITAREIARLLTLAEHGKAMIGERRITGADIAVLVRSRREGRLVADALRAQSVRCVEISIDSVFESTEAEHIERLLWVLAEPGMDARARGALAGNLFGLGGKELTDLNHDEDAWNEWTARLAEWRAHWHARGIGSLIHHLLTARDGAKVLLGLPDGLRKLTNARHLADLLQEEETSRHLTPSELATWLGHCRARRTRKNEAHELRLESDEELVKIMTVHASKGLEFPIVFCPFAWSASQPPKPNDKPDAAYHLSRDRKYREVVVLNPDEDDMAHAWLEEFAEEVRLLYVALTRAKYRCVVAWGQVNQSEYAPLAWLLHRPEKFRKRSLHGPHDAVSALEETRGIYVGKDARSWLEDMQDFAAAHEGAISCATPEEGATTSDEHAAINAPLPELAPRVLDRPLMRIRQMTSFSALSTEAHVGAPGRPAPREGEPGYARPSDAQIEAPDHDQTEPPAEGGEAAATPETAARTAFTFPRGPTPGSCLHWIFERLDDPQAEPVDLEALCRRALNRFGFAGEWQSVVRDMVRRTRAVRLHAPNPSAPASKNLGFRLDGDVPKLVELEFAFPVSDLRKERLGELLAEHGYPNPFEQSPGGDHDDALGAINGFLRGFIDLIVEDDGRWYVIDYKSNWLGPGLEDYGPDALDEAIRKGNYALQFLLYVVAFHRYLGSRLADYRYEQHVGGVFYLFTRGIDPDAGMSRGVYFNRPSESCIRALDAFFREGAA